MIYLIGGISKSGKSYIAKRIMDESKIPFFSTDFLLWSLGSDKNDDGLFNYYSPDKEVSPILEPYLLKIIYFLFKNENDYVIEGTHITPSLYNKLKEIYKENVNAVFLGYPDTLSIDKYNEVMSFEELTSNKWYKFLKKEEFLKFLDEKVEESKELETLSKKENLKFFNVKNIKNQEKEIINCLLNNTD